jgi:hypothetical protein
MKVLALSLADDRRRFERELPPKGAQLLLNPNLEIAQLCGLVRGDEIIYQDEKVEILDLTVPSDLVLISTDFWQESRIKEIATEVRALGKRVVLFGLVATIRHQDFAGVADSVVCGSILNAWPELRSDAMQSRLQKTYQASPEPDYGRFDLKAVFKPGFNPDFQCLHAVIGCRCPPRMRPFCRQHLYHGDRLRKRDLKELAAEVLALRRKHVYLLDDDISLDPEFYTSFFARVWLQKREWTVLAGERIFDSPRYLRLLAKAGVRVINLNESWLNLERLNRILTSRSFARRMANQIGLLHRQRFLAGARISLFLEPGQEVDYESTYRAIEPLGIDFLQVRFFARPAPGREFAPLFVPYESGLEADRPTWWKSRFYGLGSIVRRSLRRPVRIGFYSTFRYYYPRSFAYRQNLLEGIAYPP